MSRLYDVRPSVFIDIPDEYTGYCFDEACAYITSRIKEGEKPVFETPNERVEKQHYNSLRSMYECMGFKNGSFKKQVQ